MSRLLLIDWIDERLIDQIRLVLRRRGLSRGRRGAIDTTGNSTSAVLDDIAPDAAVLGVYGSDALFAPGFFELLQNSARAAIATTAIAASTVLAVHSERDVFDDLQAAWTQLSFATCAGAVACDTFLFGEELGCQIRCEVASVFRFSNASSFQ